MEKQPGEPISLIYRPGKEFSDKMETRAGGKTAWRTDQFDL